MRVIVIGGTGHIGAYLVPKLLRPLMSSKKVVGIEITILDPRLLMEVAKWWILENELDRNEKAVTVKEVVKFE